MKPGRTLLLASLLLLGARFPESARGQDRSELRDALQDLSERWIAYESASPEDRELETETLLDATRECVALALSLDRLAEEECEQLLMQACQLLYVPVEWWIDAEEVAGEVADWVRPLARELERGWAASMEYELAAHAMKRHDLSGAASLLDDATRSFPDEIGLVLLQVDLFRLEDRWEDALRALEQAENILADSPRGPNSALDAGQVVIARASLDSRLGRADRAMLGLEGLLGRTAKDTEVPAQIASAALEQLADVGLLCGALDRVLALADERSRIVPEHLSDFELKIEMARTGLALRERRVRRNDLDAFEAALDAPNLKATAKVLGRLRLADLHLDLGDLAAAEAALIRAQALIESRRPGPFGETSHREWALLTALRVRHARISTNSDGLRRWEKELDHRFDSFLKDWHSTPLLPGGIGFLRSALRRTLVHEVLQLELRRGGAARAFESLLRLQALGSFARRRSLKAPALREIESTLLSRGEGLLVFLPTYLGSHLFVLEAESVRHYELAAEHELKQAFAELSSGSETVQHILPREVRDAVEGWSLVRAVGVELLGRAPLNEVPWREGRSLGQIKPVAELPSVPVGVFLARRAEPRPVPESLADLVLIVGPPDPVDGVDPLPFEAAALTSAYEGRVQVFGRDGSAARDAAASLETAGALHFLCHGTVDRKRERFAGLSIDADEEPLWADELESWELPPLVILTACSSGEGPLRVGEDGVSHLGGAAIAAGANTVIVGIGEIDRDRTLKMIQALHRGLSRGETPAEALRQARVDSASSGASVPLRLIGLGDRRAVAAPRLGADRSWIRTLAMTTGVMLIAAAAWSFARSRRSRTPAG